MTMATACRRILFVSHSASLNGASIMLLHTLRWMKRNTNHELHVLCLGRGPLLDDYREVARTHLLRNPARLLRGLPEHWSEAIRAIIEKAMSRWLLRRYRFDLVYANTTAVWRQVTAAAGGHVPVLWHIHELPYALRLSMGDIRAREILPLATRVVAVSAAVREALSGLYAVPAERIDMIHGHVDDDLTVDRQRKAVRTRILASLGWPADAFVVGGCGGLGWRKGTDLFLQVAARCRSATGQPMRFLWVGGNASSLEAHQFSHDVQRLGLQDTCQHVPSTPDVLDYYHSMDVFALTSREDPFPLVMLEAGVRGVPTVCFASAGGGSEFVDSHAGVAVPYLSLTDFASALLQLKHSPELRRQMGQAARGKVLREHGVDTQGPKLVRSIERCLSLA